MSAPDRQQREEALEAMWLALARAWTAILEGTDPSDLTAAQLTSARQFLLDQGVTHQTIRADKECNNVMASELARQVAEVSASLRAEEEAELPAPHWPERLEDR